MTCVIVRLGVPVSMKEKLALFLGVERLGRWFLPTWRVSATTWSRVVRWNILASCIIGMVLELTTLVSIRLGLIEGNRLTLFMTSRLVVFGIVSRSDRTSGMLITESLLTISRLEVSGPLLSCPKLVAVGLNLSSWRTAWVLRFAVLATCPVVCLAGV